MAANDRKGARSRLEDFQDQCWTLSRVGSQPCCSSSTFEWGMYETMILWNQINRPWAVAGMRRLIHTRSETVRDKETVEEQYNGRRGKKCESAEGEEIVARRMADSREDRLDT